MFYGVKISHISKRVKNFPVRDELLRSRQPQYNFVFSKKKLSDKKVLNSSTFVWSQYSHFMIALILSLWWEGEIVQDGGRVELPLESQNFCCLGKFHP